MATAASLSCAGTAAEAVSAATADLPERPPGATPRRASRVRSSPGPGRAAPEYHPWSAREPVGGLLVRLTLQVSRARSARGLLRKPVDLLVEDPPELVDSQTAVPSTASDRAPRGSRLPPRADPTGLGRRRETRRRGARDRAARHYAASPPCEPGPGTGLERVGGVVVIAEHPPADPQHQRPRAAHQRLEGDLIAGGGELPQQLTSGKPRGSPDERPGRVLGARLRGVRSPCASLPIVPVNLSVLYSATAERNSMRFPGKWGSFSLTHQPGVPPSMMLVRSHAAKDAGFSSPRQLPLGLCGC